MPKKNLKLNSLSRYSKQSSRLTLEEHGHCEIPAGCGGVVLRWRNPESIPVQIHFHTHGKVDFFLDGKQPVSNLALLSYGEHVLAFRISQSLTARFQPNQGLLMFAGFYDEKQMNIKVIGNSQKNIYILSKPDDSWKYSLSKPANDSWLYAGFDDSAWTPMEFKSLPKPKKNEIGDYHLTHLKGLGAQGLGITKRHLGKTVWIRKSFILENKKEKSSSV
jgi:hypothetical protein